VGDLLEHIPPPAELRSWPRRWRSCPPGRWHRRRSGSRPGRGRPCWWRRRGRHQRCWHALHVRRHGRHRLRRSTCSCCHRSRGEKTRRCCQRGRGRGRRRRLARNKRVVQTEHVARFGTAPPVTRQLRAGLAAVRRRPQHRTPSILHARAARYGATIPRAPSTHRAVHSVLRQGHMLEHAAAGRGCGASAEPVERAEPPLLLLKCSLVQRQETQQRGAQQRHHASDHRKHERSSCCSCARSVRPPLELKTPVNSPSVKTGERK